MGAVLATKPHTTTLKKAGHVDNADVSDNDVDAITSNFLLLCNNMWTINLYLSYFSTKPDSTNNFYDHVNNITYLGYDHANNATYLGLHKKDISHRNVHGVNNLDNLKRYTYW